MDKPGNRNPPQKVRLCNIYGGHGITRSDLWNKVSLSIHTDHMNVHTSKLCASVNTVLWYKATRGSTSCTAEKHDESEKWVSEWVSEWVGFNIPSTDYGLFWRRVFTVNHLHWYWQPNKNEKNHSEKCKHCALAVVRRSQTFSPRRRSRSRGRRTAKI